MPQFIVGLIVGFVIGVVVLGYNPQFAEEVQTAIGEVTGTVLRGTEEAAEAVGQAAGDAANETERAPGEAEDAVPVERVDEEAPTEVQ